MKEIYIVGAGGFGREVFGWLQATSGFPDLKFCGFLDDNPDALKGMDYDKGVVAPISNFVVKSSHLFVCGIGDVATKMKLCKPLMDRGAKFMSVVHPTAIVGNNVKLGHGVVLCPGVILTCDVEVGDMVMINCNSSAGHDVKVGDWSTISAYCDLTGYTRLGKGVFLGSGARIIPGKSIGDDGFVGAGSVVIRSVESGQKVFGNPSRVFG